MQKHDQEVLKHFINYLANFQQQHASSHHDRMLNKFNFARAIILAYTYIYYTVKISLLVDPIIGTSLIFTMKVIGKSADTPRFL